MKTQQRDQIEYMDKNGKIYNSIFTFKEDALIKKIMADLFKMRVICKEIKWNRHKECLKIHKLVYHGDQQFKGGPRPIEYSCMKENEKPKCSTLKSILGEPKYKKGKEYPNMESFQNRTSLPEIEIQESQRKK